MTSKDGDKSAAWDSVGGLFWSEGRASARPSSSEIDTFLEGLAYKSRVAIIGASTKEMIEAAISREFVVTVFDFSRRMCADLADAIDTKTDIRVHDITTRELLIGDYDAVLSDRLINRFTREEGIEAFTGMLGMVAPGGSVRASVKLGLYPMDKRMIEEGRNRDVLEQFYDERTRTINFSTAGEILDTCLLPHGDINRDILLTWYRGRGKESRYDEVDILSMASEARIDEFALRQARSVVFPDANDTVCYFFDALETK